MHPLIDDLSSFRDTELETKISQLTNHYYSSSNPQVKQQLIMLARFQNFTHMVINIFSCLIYSDFQTEQLNY